MGVEQLIIVAIVLFLSSMVQAMIGFAFNLIAIPLLIWNGFSLASSVALTSIPIFIQLITNTWRLHDDIEWKIVLPSAIIRYITLPIGIALLYAVNSLDTATIKQFVGVMLLLIIATQLLVSFKPRDSLPFVWDILAFGISGIMLGMIGMGGPAVVLWLMAHSWSARKTRAFISALFLMSAPVQIALLYWKLGDQVAEAFVWGIASTPIVIIAAMIGVRIGDTFDKKRLTKVVMIFLFLTAIISIISPYL